ncbi:MAG: hypothetical protein IPJ77_22565 [Planctomycetes bacterium]|nr:hypothetical protein [Planctomycetota bacterium]
MILPRGMGSGEPFLQASLASPCFVVLWTTGPDTTLDGVVRLLARRRTSTGDWEVFDRWCDPREGSERSLPGMERWSARFGRDARALAGEGSASAAWAEFARFAEGAVLVVPDAAGFRAWRAHAGAGASSERALTGLAEIAGLLFPGRLAQRREHLLASLVEPTAGEGSDAYGPDDLNLAVDELARRFLEREEDVLRIAVQGFRNAWSGLAGTDPRARDALAIALALVDRRSQWSLREVARSPRLHTSLAALLEPEVPIEDLLEAVEPRCTRELERWKDLEVLPSDTLERAAFDPADRVVLDDVFERHLPATFATDGRAPNYRKSQHEVARAVAGALGTKELLLVHAPTGTGKTLAYLVPSILWARRNSVRVGIATYTRALQEQAMDREVPRALSALARAGVASGTRITVLKGRDNYVCWRALKLAVPTADEDGETWLAWTQLALFALTDLEGDLDRMPMAPPIALEDESVHQRALQALVRHARAQVACCTQSDDRNTCAAEVVRQRAQKSHVVIVNQAFALARQEFFRHVVFDECEHLHDQAHNAWSHTIGLKEMRSLLARLSTPDRERSRALLDRVERQLLEGTPAHEVVTRCHDAWRAASQALADLDDAARAFDAWRTGRLGEREDRDTHSLLREYVGAFGNDGVGEPGAEALLAARASFMRDWVALETQLAELAERLDALPLRGLPRMRRALGETRTDLAETLVAIEAWLPLDEGKPAFRPRTFYDVERDARGDLVLASRVLLPNEFLGRSYYPQLASGIFLSATTVLQDGFESSLAYLGLDRAASPAPDEERPPCVVRTFRAPEVFDYSRVLVAVPRDAPPASGDKGAFLDYVRRFVGHLGERTRGRMLVLFTNAQDTVKVGEELAGFFRARSIPLWFQNMEGRAKEELGELFRARVDSVLLGVDTFWYGADFPGETLEYLVIVKLPYGVPDRYHHAQCAVLGLGEQRRRIYLPRALAKFRQGFGRLMRRESDRGCVFILDGRVLDPRHRFFLKELPIERPFEFGAAITSPARGAKTGSARETADGARPADAGGSTRGTSRARFVRAETDQCIRAALEHMGLVDDVKQRGLAWSFASGPDAASDSGSSPSDGGSTPSDSSSTPSGSSSSPSDRGSTRREPRTNRTQVAGSDGASGAQFDTEERAPASPPPPAREAPAPIDVSLDDLPY